MSRARAALTLLAAALATGAAAPSGAAAGTAIVSWGTGGHGELGAGYRPVLPGNEDRPVSVIGGLSSISSVTAAGNTSFAVLGNGTVRSWGADLHEQLGDGEAKGDREKPVTVVEKTAGGEQRELTGVTAVASYYASDTHVMALVNDSEHEGEVFTWGASEYGERGNGEYSFFSEHGKEPRNVAIPVPGLKHIVQIAAGGDTDFALQEEAGVQTLWAWGQATGGRLGIGELTGLTECKGEGGVKQCATEPRRVEIPAGVKIASIGAGKQDGYAVTSTGAVLAWGENDHGQLGTGTTTDSNVPVYVCAVGASAPCGEEHRLTGVTQVTGGDYFTLALEESGAVVGWGSNGYGQLGGSSNEECSKTLKTCQKIPKVVAGIEHATQVAAGREFSVALSGGKVYGWGENEQGNLGIGTRTGPETCPESTPCSRTPVLVEGLAAVGDISAGGAEKDEGQVLAVLETGSGPAPLFSVVPAKHHLKVVWRFTAETVEIGWRVAKSEVNFTKIEKFSGPTCTAEAPCTHEIAEELSPEHTYEVKLDSWHVVSGKKVLESRRISSENQPEP